MSEPIQFSALRPFIREAGQLALSYYQTQIKRLQKDDLSPVTEADKAVEAFLIQKIEQLYPTTNYHIIGEESGGIHHQSKEFAWVIDPIDGTRVFIDGLPTWAICVGLLRWGEVYRGAVYLPVSDEMYYTDDEGQAFWSARQGQMVQPLANMMLDQWHTDSFMGVSSGVHRYFDIDFHRLRAFGAIATHHVYVARGAAVAAFHRQTALWDIAAAHAILTAVGGIAVYLDGQPISITNILNTGRARGPILAAHPLVIEQLLPRIKHRP